MKKTLPWQGDREKQFREVSIQRGAVKAEDRTVDLAFSSEEPVIRWFGIEILSHDSGAMRMDRMNSGGALLMDHDPSDMIGVVEGCRCDPDKMGRATVRFSRSTRAEEIFQDVQDGIRKNVSVGYAVHHAEEMDPKQMPAGLMEMAAREKLPVYRVTDWEPLEISVVAVPADPSVGIGRSAEVVAEKPPGEIQPTTESREEAPLGASVILSPQREDGQMEPNSGKTMEEIEKDMDGQRKKAGDAARDQERLRVQGINDIYEKFRQFIPEFVRRKAVDEGMPLQDFQANALKRMEDPKPIEGPITEIGLSPREVKRYSITRAILSQVHDEKGVDCSFEKACHTELVKKLGTVGRGGVFVPYEVFRDQHADRRGTGAVQRDLSLGSDAAGAYLKGTDHLGSEFVDVLRNALVLRRAGARVLTGLRGNVQIPKRTAGATSYWVAEGIAPTEGANTFGQLALSPKNVAAFVDYTRNLLLQSNPSVDGLVNGDLALSLATAIDLAGFHGAAGSEPQGIVGTENVGSTTATTVSLAKMLDFQTDVAGANALAGSCAYITTPAVAAILAAVPKFTYSSVPLWNGNLLEAQDVCGFRGFATNQITAGYMIFGDFSQVVIGEWGVLELLVNPYILSSAGIIRVTAFQSVDVGLRYPGAFSVATSVTAPA